MNAPSLPAASPVPTATSPAGSSASSTEVAPTDFLLMLGQLLGSGAPSNNGAAKTPVTAAATESDTDASEGSAEAALASMMPFASMVPWNSSPHLPAPGAATADALSSLEMMSLAGGGSGGGADSIAKDAQLLTALTDALKTDDAAAPVQGSPVHPSSVEASQGLRVVAGSDATGTRMLHHPVGSSAWADELGTRMTLMADRGQHSASLRLSPEHLGPLEVRIAIRDDQASVWFGAAHADTRAAIEQALPRLRELFASQGLSLADTGVHHQAPRDPQRSSPASGTSPDAAAAEADAIAQVGPIRLGLFDAYA